MATHRVAVLVCLALVMPVCRAEMAIPSAYVTIADRVGVPPKVLYAIALVESGTALKHGIRPWPWTLNVAGKPMRFVTQAEACQALTRTLKNIDAKRVDVGLGQTNLGYHPERYAFPCQALNPYQNLSVTAQLLHEHFQQAGDWTTAAGRYHRPAGGAPAARYQVRFTQQLNRLASPSSGGPR